MDQSLLESAVDQQTPCIRLLRDDGQLRLTGARLADPLAEASFLSLRHGHGGQIVEQLADRHFATFPDCDPQALLVEIAGDVITGRVKGPICGLKGIFRRTPRAGGHGEKQQKDQPHGRTPVTLRAADNVGYIRRPPCSEPDAMTKEPRPS